MKYIDVLNLNMVNLLAENPERFYVDNDIYLALSARAFGQKNLRIGQPYRVEEGRLVMVTAGWSRIIANLEEYELHTGMAFVLPPDSILEIVEHSDDLDMRAVTFKDLPLSAGFNHAICLQLTPQVEDLILIKQFYFDKFDLLSIFVDLIYHLINQEFFHILQHFSLCVHTFLFLPQADSL
jgi:hypothetical protein